MQTVEEIRILCSPLVLKEVLASLALNKTKGLASRLQQVLERERFHQSPLPLSRLQGLWAMLYARTKENGLLFFVNYLHFLARKYFRWSFRLGLPVLKEEKVLAFQHLLGYILTDQLWLFALACDFEDSSRPRPRRRIPSGWKEFFLPPVDNPILLKLRGQGMVEIHRHLSGSVFPLILWENFLRRWRTFIKQCLIPYKLSQLQTLIPPEIEPKEFLLWTCLIPAIRGFLLYQKEHFEKNRQEYLEKIRQALFYQDLPSIFSLNEELASFFSNLNGNSPGIEERYFLLETYQKILSSDELPPDYEWWFYAYLLLQNQWLRVIVLSKQGIGFERFERLAHAPSRDFLEKVPTEILQKALRLEGRNGVKAIEWRIKPDEKFSKFSTKLEKIAQIYRNDQEKKVPPAGVILHFIKGKDELDNFLESCPVLPVRHWNLRRKLWRIAHAILQFKRLSPKRRFIIGLDAANNELYTPPEVFSPVIRFLRTEVFENNSPLDTSKASPLGLTFHAGESFRHLLSGLRYIDETIEFLEMQPGDRLGHALAMGLAPEEWIKNREVLLMAREEWLDDLVWFVHSLSITRNFPELVLRYQQEIFQHLHYIYGQQTEIESYFRVWKYLRREEALFLPYLPSYDFFKPVQWLLEAQRNLPEKDFELWKRYHLDREVRRRATEFIEVEIDPSLIEGLKAIQEELLQKCVKQQIIIEINPSSNLAIGELEDLSEHPVFRWAPPKASQKDALPWIVVGSDDPGIFQTQLWHEYIFLTYAAKKKGASFYEISSWLEELVQNSYRFTFLELPSNYKTGSSV